DGRDTCKIGEFVERDGMVFPRPQEFGALGFRVPAGAAVPDGLVPLASLPGMQYRVERTSQSLLVTAPDAALLPALLGSGSATGAMIPVQSGIGATLNYDLVGTRAGGQNTVSGQFDLRGFSPWGVPSSGLLFYPQATEQSP